MKNIQVKSHFKSVSKAQAERQPVLGDKVGKKRPDLAWSFEGFETLDEVANQAHAIFFLNKAIEDYGRSLIADNLTDWGYAPSPDSLTLAAAYDYLTAETNRARTLTKVTALAFAKFYAKHAAELIGINPAAAEAAQVVIVDWLTYAKKDNFRTAMYARLYSFAEAIVSLPEDSQVAAGFADDEADLPAVLDALIKAFSEAENTTITADAL